MSRRRCLAMSTFANLPVRVKEGAVTVDGTRGLCERRAEMRLTRAAAR